MKAKKRAILIVLLLLLLCLAGSLPFFRSTAVEEALVTEQTGLTAEQLHAQAEQLGETVVLPGEVTMGQWFSVQRQTLLGSQTCYLCPCLYFTPEIVPTVGEACWTISLTMLCVDEQGQQCDLPAELILSDAKMEFSYNSTLSFVGDFRSEHRIPQQDGGRYVVRFETGKLDKLLPLIVFGDVTGTEQEGLEKNVTIRCSYQLNTWLQKALYTGVLEAVRDYQLPS